MENSMSQRRVSFSESGQGGRRESFKDKKTQNWFQKQFSSQTSYNHEESMDSEFTTAIAAATFVVHSLDEATSQNLSRKQGSFRLSESARIPSRKLTKDSVGEGSMKKRMGQDDKAPSSARPRPLVTGDNNNNTRNGRRGGTLEDWERAEMTKIQKRYEKSKIRILGWENERKMRAKSRMEAKKNELEKKRAMNWKHYQNKLARIDHIAGGARAQVEENKRKEENIVKEKSKKMKLKGKSHYWICC